MWFLKFFTNASACPTQEDTYDSTMEPFLPSDGTGITKGIAGGSRKAHFTAAPLTYLLLLSFAAGSVSTLIGFATLGIKSNKIAMSTYSPVDHLIEQQNVVFTSGFGDHKTIYQGPSTTERDKAWQELYGFGISRIPRASAAKLVNKTVPLPGSPGYYVVSLNVFHQLHCVNTIRQRLWSYELSEPVVHDPMETEHFSHCLDAIRQSLMCSVDVTPLPWQWDSAKNRSMPIADIQHTCRNFEKVHQWARENAAGRFDTNVYVPDDL